MKAKVVLHDRFMNDRDLPCFAKIVAMLLWCQRRRARKRITKRKSCLRGYRHVTVEAKRTHAQAREEMREIEREMHKKGSKITTMSRPCHKACHTKATRLICQARGAMQRRAKCCHTAKTQFYKAIQEGKIQLLPSCKKVKVALLSFLSSFLLLTRWGGMQMHAQWQGHAGNEGERRGEERRDHQ